jgi:predicted ester cyclase
MEEIRSPDFVDRNIGPGYPGGSHLEYYRQVEKEFGTAFSNVSTTINHLLAEGDKVVVHSTTTCTHTGVFRGKPPTGKQVTYTVITIYRLADGKIVESWDCLGLHRDLEQFFEP